MKNWIYVFLITAISLTISLFSGALNWMNQFVICGITYFLAGLIYQRNFKISRLLYGAIVVLPFLSIYTVIVISQNLSHVYPIAFLPPIPLIIGLIMNRLFANGMPKSTILTLISVSIAMILLLGYFGMPNWLAYTLNKKAFDEFPAPSIVLSAHDGELFNLNNQAGKVLVLDFWSTGCSICFKKFPEFDKLKQKYTSQSDIEFYAVNLIYPKEQISSLKKVIDSFSYSFKTLYTDQNSVKQIRELLKIDAVPTIVVIDKKGMVVYSGALYIEKFVFIDNIYNIIESAKNNE